MTEPYSAGIGGGGYFVYYDAKTGKVHTIDGRETAPAAMPHDAFIDPATGKPYTSPPNWSPAASPSASPARRPRGSGRCERWGTLVAGRGPAAGRSTVAQRGFVVDETFRQQTLDNEVRFEAFTADAASCSCRAATPPAVG